MSVILDALNKSGNESSGGTGTFKPSSGGGKPPRKPDKTRVIVLSVAAVLGLSVIGLYNLKQKFSNDQPVAVVMPIKSVAKPAAAAIKATPAEIASIRQEATDFMNAGKIKESLESFDKLNKLSPDDPEALNNLGMAFRRTGDVAKARAAYQSALSLKPDYAEALNNLAVLEIQSGDLTAAKENLTKAIAKDPQFVGAVLNLAVCEEQLGDVINAQTHYQSFLTRSRGMVDRRIRLAVEEKLSRFVHDAAQNQQGNP